MKSEKSHLKTTSVGEKYCKSWVSNQHCEIYKKRKKRFYVEKLWDYKMSIHIKCFIQFAFSGFVLNYQKCELFIVNML